MGKASRRRQGRPGAGRASTGGGAAGDGGEVPVVGLREPCPCGSGRRYKQCHGRGRDDGTALARRPFEGLPGEADWVALREIVPAATVPLRLAAAAVELGFPADSDAVAATVLPLAWPGLHRADGQVWIGLQSASSSGDPSRDLADALLRAAAAEPGTPVAPADLPGPGPRLQDLLDLDAAMEVTVHEGFDFWVADASEIGSNAEVRESLERANSAVVPTVRLGGVEAAYWCRIGDRTHLRWVMSEDEEALLDAIARLHAAGESRIGDTGRYIGAFRAHGLLVPVWDLAPEAEARDVEPAAAAFQRLLADALARTEPLTADERRARAGVVSRQVTLR